MTTRAASHAGSWYTASPSILSSELDGWLAKVVDGSKGINLPIPGARVIIAPLVLVVLLMADNTGLIVSRHAGYEHSGATAAWAYKYLDFSNAKHIFLLGPSHTLSLSGCALSTHSRYATVFGDIQLDREIIKELQATKKFITWDQEFERKEHSLEMHLPYIYKMISKQFKSDSEHPTLIPILVGGTSAAAERLYGQILAPYLAKPTSVFIVSSDFCHWGLRFYYMRYLPETDDPTDLKRGQENPTKPPIYDSIGRLDKLAMEAIEGGRHRDFLNNLRETGNTVCGRHPIGVAMAAIEVLEQEGKISGEENGRFKFIQYKRSEEVQDIYGSSVSYASAVAVL
jgi:MEMO1 family protein